MKAKKLLLICLFFSCTLPNIQNRTGIQEIAFGSGGGFAGQFQKYKLMPDGRILDGEKVMAVIDYRKTFSIYKEAGELKDIQYNEPGNMYYFVEIISGSKSNQLVWEYGSTAVNPKTTRLYNQLISLITP